LQKNSTARAAWLYYLAFFSIFLLSVYGFFYCSVDSGFSVIFGNEYDAVIEAVLVSHWYHVLGLTQAWNQDPYFYPYRDTLGYNDGYFLFGMIGAVFRVLGANLFVAQELVHVTIKAIGFIAMVLFMDRLRPRGAINLLTASLFTLFLNDSNQGGHGQLLELALLPLLALLLLNCVSAVMDKHRRRFVLNGIAFGVLFNAALITGFYMAWFFGLIVILFAVMSLFFNFAPSWRLIRAAWALKLERLVFAAVFLITALPFAAVYLPKLHETGGQSYVAQLFYSLHWWDFMNVPGVSLFWCHFTRLAYATFPAMFRQGEFSVGFTPDVILLLVIVFLLSIFNRTGLPAWFRALAFATLLGFCLPVSIDGDSLWYYVDHLVPGSNGMRTICRFYIALDFPIALLIGLFLGRLADSMPRARGVIYVAFALICLGQFNLVPPVGLQVPVQMALVQRAARPPSSCRAFFVTNPISPPMSHTDRLYRQNVQAMVLADAFGIPTLNGFATFNPKDWIFTQTGLYLYFVQQYIAAHHLSGVCRYDMTQNQWTGPELIDFTPQPRVIAPSQKVNFSLLGNSDGVMLDGWAHPERWGTWSITASPKLIIQISPAPTGDAVLSFTSHAFVVHTHPQLSVTVLVNNVALQTFVYRAPEDGGDHLRQVNIPAAIANKSHGVFLITFGLKTPESPRAAGVGNDIRNLGLGIASLSVAPK
jgi:hypothetical protein